jgi:hypothetical protein
VGFRTIAVPGALSVAGGITALPEEGTVLRFGRNRSEVDICVGEDDLQVSRVHGLLTCLRGQWWLDAVGRTPIRMPGAVLLHSDADPVPIPTGFTPLFLQGSRGREHQLELYVAGAAGRRPPSQPSNVTEEPRRWRLSPVERLVLVVLGQRYLRNDKHPQPLSRQQIALELAELQPDAGWTVKKVEHYVSTVRHRLSRSGVFGLRQEEVGEPVGMTLAANLMHELLNSSSIAPSDLNLLENPINEATD